MTLVQFPKTPAAAAARTKYGGSSRNLNVASMHSIARLTAKLLELAQIGQPWHLTVIERLVDRMLVRLRKRQARLNEEAENRRRR